MQLVLTCFSYCVMCLLRRPQLWVP